MPGPISPLSTSRSAEWPSAASSSFASRASIEPRNTCDTSRPTWKGAWYSSRPSYSRRSSSGAPDAAIWSCTLWPSRGWRSPVRKVVSPSITSPAPTSKM